MGNTTQKQSPQDSSLPSVANLAATLASTAISNRSGLNNSDRIIKGGLELEVLPLELWHLILSFCEDKDLAINIPRVCQVLYNLSEADGMIWKSKCKTKYGENVVKPSDKSWKRHYLKSAIKLFPLLDFIQLGKTNYNELVKVPGAAPGVSGSSRYVTIQGHNFWVHEQEVFHHMYIVNGLYPMPDEWVRQGIVWNKSWNEYKELITKWTGTCEIVEPAKQADFNGKMCFSGALRATVRENDVTINMTFQFDYHVGTEETPDTLYSITIEKVAEPDIISVDYTHNPPPTLDFDEEMLYPRQE